MVIAIRFRDGAPRLARRRHRGRGGQARRIAADLDRVNQPLEHGVSRLTTGVDVRDGGGIRMRFFLPVALTRHSAPEPTNPAVQIVEVPEETIATLRFSGTGHDMPERQATLLAALAGSHWQPVGDPYALFYDAPFTLPFVRRNEAAVPVAPRVGR